MILLLYFKFYIFLNIILFIKHYIFNKKLNKSINFIFFFNDTATTEIYTLSLHDALPIFAQPHRDAGSRGHERDLAKIVERRSEEHTSELQSRRDLVCRLLLEKKKKK